MRRGAAADAGLAGPLIRIVIADDHLVVRLGLERLIGAQPDMRVLADTGSGPDLVELYWKVQPDVILLDPHLSGGAGMAAIKSICAAVPEARLVAMSSHRGDEAIYQALRAGACGYLFKDAAGPDIVGAIRAVRAGGAWIPSEVAARIAENLQYEALTAREIDVLKRMARGLSNAEIGRDLGTSTGTARNRVASLMAKLRVRDRTHAVTLALQRGILQLESLDVVAGRPGAWEREPRDGSAAKALTTSASRRACVR